jgi:hypothetical protein
MSVNAHPGNGTLDRPLNTCLRTRQLADHEPCNYRCSTVASHRIGKPPAACGPGTDSR